VEVIPPPMPAPPGGGNDAPKDDGDSTPPQQRAIYLLPEGAKEGAKRALKKLIQQWQDGDLRAIREGTPRPAIEITSAELSRWLGDNASVVMSELIARSAPIEGDHDTVNAAYNALKSDESLTRLLEVEASTPFFTGLITHEVYKAMVLELDPDDDEAEQAIRMDIERRFERELSGAFKEQLGDLLPDGASDDVIRNAPNQVQESSGFVREVLRRNLEQGSSLGVSVSLDTLEQIGLGFDWTLAHADAAQWASQYSYELVRRINTTSQKDLQRAVNDWFNERTTLADLVKELQPTFGKRRAQAIAQTETTRAAAEGSVTGYEHSGVVQESEWVSVRDERVCPICGDSPTGLHGKRAPLRGTFPGGKSYPPAHPYCRCFIRPVIGD
jgi:SPP1 gp7 family putative phage head morphogenesis protein